MTDFPDWQAPQANATAIAGTGVPLLTSASLVTNQTKSVAAAATQVLGPFTISQIGYELLITASIPAAATNPFIEVVINWFDSGTNTLMQTDSFAAVCGTATLTNFVTAMRGPSKADQVRISLTNADSAQAATVNVTMLQNSRVYPSDLLYWPNLWPTTLAVPVFTLPTIPPDEDCLGILSAVAIPASSSITRLMAPYNGPIIVGFNMNTGQLSSLNFFLAPEPLSNYGSNNPVFGATPPSSSFTVGGPRAPLRMVVTNTATTSVTVTMGLWRGQQV